MAELAAAIIYFSFFCAAGAMCYLIYIRPFQTSVRTCFVKY